MDVFEDGILVGWYHEAYNHDGKKMNCFVPRREEDVEEDIRAAYETN